MTAPERAVPRAASSGAGLVRAIGVLGLAAGIVNITIGGSIFRMPAEAAATLGSAAPLAYIVCGVALTLIVLCFAEAGSRVSATGGLYAYVEVAFGPLVGFLSGWVLVIGLTVAMAAISTFFADSIAALVPALSSPLAEKGTIIVTIAALSVLNVLGVRQANRFNVAMTFAKLVPLALLVAVGAFHVRSQNLAIHALPSGSVLARASVTLMFAFLGVESALVPSGEVRDPARTVPRAVFVGLAVVVLAYLAIHVVAEGVLGDALATSKTPLADAAAMAMGGSGRTLILVGSTISMFGFLSAMTLATPRMWFAFAEHGFLPRVVGRVHPRFRTPAVAIVVQAVLTVAIALSGTFGVLANIANAAVLLVYAACCAAAVVLRRRGVRTGSGEPYRTPGGMAVPVAALIVIVVLLGMGLRPAEWLAVGIAFAAGLIVYVVAASRGSVRGSEIVAAE